MIIVLGALFVGIALTIGITLVLSSSYQVNKDALISDLMRLAAIARVHYYRPAELGGGGYSYVNFNIPPAFAQTENGTIKQIKKDHKSDHIYFEAIGKNGVDPIIIEAEITIDDIKLKEHGKKQKKKTPNGKGPRGEGPPGQNKK